MSTLDAWCPLYPVSSEAFCYVHIALQHAFADKSVFVCIVWLPSPGVLQEAQVPVIGRTQCDNLLGPGVITRNMICAGLLQGGRDTCQVRLQNTPSEHTA